MTRITITDTEITIKRSDLPTHPINPYPEHDLEASVVSFDFGGTEVFHNAKDGYEHWLSEQEDYILTELGALIASREIDAQLGQSSAEQLRDELWAEMNPGFAPLVDGHPDANYYSAIASALVAAGWSK